MIQEHHPADDPRLTAYLLGELDAAERAEFETQLQNRPQLRAALEELSSLTGTLTSALVDEPLPRLAKHRRDSVLATLKEISQWGTSTNLPQIGTEVSTPARRHWWGTGAIAACSIMGLTILFAARPDQRAPQAMSAPATTHSAPGMDVAAGIHPSLESQSELALNSAPAASGAEVSHPFSSTDDFSPDPNSLVLRDPVQAVPMSPGLQGAGSGYSITPLGRNSARPEPMKMSSSSGVPLATQPLSGTSRPMATLTPNPGEPAPATSPATALSVPRDDWYSLDTDAAGTLRQVPPSNSAQARGNLETRFGRSLDEREPLRRGESSEGKTRLLLSDVPSTPNQESYASIVENEFISPRQVPFSTFGVDVDTASYANVRRFLENSQWPPADAVRLEELINAFQYSATPPTEQHPVSLSAEAAACPWQPAHQLVRISVKGKEIPRESRPATSLVFLIDKSGSMSDSNKLPLLKDSLRMLVEELGEQDRISIVTYANGASLVLEGATANDRTRIMNAIDSLTADGSTNGEAGLNLAYEVAVRNRIAEGANRILVCTDGDFNVGQSSDDALFRLIGEKRQTQIFLSILGFGSGNLKDSKLEGIARQGNGHYVYIDGLKEARRVLVEQLTGTLYTIARDVKLQVEFNPGKVSYYRLLGYENRALAAEDFNNDRVDAGDMGAGHTVTALYEIVPAGTQPQGVPVVDESRYGAAGTIPSEVPPLTEVRPAPGANELLFVKLRYQYPEGGDSVKLEFPVLVPEAGVLGSEDMNWAATVAGFGLLLRDSKFKGNLNWDDLLGRSRTGLGNDPTGQRREFVDMVFRARSLWKRSHGESPGAPVRLSSGDARTKATCGGKYSNLLDKLEIPEDQSAYGDFVDFGLWRGTAYKGYTNLPEGHWVYVYPHWYLWGEVRSE